MIGIIGGRRLKSCCLLVHDHTPNNRQHNPRQSGDGGAGAGEGREPDRWITEGLTGPHFLDGHRLPRLHREKILAPNPGQWNPKKPVTISLLKYPGESAREAGLSRMARSAIGAKRSVGARFHSAP